MTSLLWGVNIMTDVDQAAARKIAATLFGAVYADGSLDSTAQESRITQINGLRIAVLGEPADAAPTADLALSELKAMDRAAEASGLDKAAASLAGVTALLTGLFTGVGFSTGDFARMIRDSPFKGFSFLILASLAILLGTFAFVINAAQSPWKLRAEKAAVYVGILFAATAFFLASWGLSQGASAATTPTISASFDTSATPPILKVTIGSSDVPRQERIVTTAWGADRTGKWTVLSHLSSGAASDGTADGSMTISNTNSYTQIEIIAAIAATDTTPPASPTTPCPSDMSCVILPGGLATPSPSPSTSASSSSAS